MITEAQRVPARHTDEHDILYQLLIHQEVEE